MKTRLSPEFLLYALIVALCLVAILLTIAAGEQFKDAKVVYQGF